MNDYILPRSQKALKVELAMLAAATLVTAILALLLVRAFFRVAQAERWYSGMFVSLVIFCFGYFAMAVRQKKWKDVSYKLTPDSIMVNQGDGFLSTTCQVYLYESIISATMNQGYFDRKYGYGDIVLVIPKLGADIRLKSLSDPEKQLKLLQSNLKDKARRHTLVT